MKKNKLNEENNWSEELNVEKVSAKAVKAALNLMKTRKAPRPSGVTYALLKECKNESEKKLAEVADYLLLRKNA